MAANVGDASPPLPARESSAAAAAEDGDATPTADDEVAVVVVSRCGLVMSKNAGDNDELEAITAKRDDNAEEVVVVVAPKEANDEDGPVEAEVAVTPLLEAEEVEPMPEGKLPS